MAPRTEGVDESNIVTHRRQPRPKQVNNASTSSSKKSRSKRKIIESGAASDLDIIEVESTKGVSSSRRSPHKKQKMNTQKNCIVTDSESEIEEVRPPETKGKNLSPAASDLTSRGQEEPALVLTQQDIEAARKKSRKSRKACIHLFFDCAGENEPRYCKICTQIRAKDGVHFVHSYSYSTGNSSLEKHINKDHPRAAGLLQKLKEEGVPSDLPENVAHINGIFKKQAPNKSVSFSKEEFALRCLRLISACDLPLSIVEKPEFEDLCVLLRPSLNSRDIPTRQRMASLALSQLGEIKAAVKRLLNEAKGRVSFTVDCWSAGDMDNFVGITSHYLNDDWELKEELLGFEQSNTGHTGKALARIIFKVLDSFGLVKKGKLGWFTTDNAVNNDTMMVELEKMFRDAGIPQDDWDCRSKHIRCMPHIYNLAVGDIVAALGKKAYANETEAANANPSDDDMKVPLVRLRKFIVTVRLSTLKRHAFAELQQIHYPDLNVKKDEKGALLGALVLVLDVITRWSSTYFMLRRALRLRRAIDTMVVHSDHSDQLSKYQLTHSDWKNLEFLAIILEKANMCQQLLSSTSYPTLQFSIPAIEHLQSAWEELQGECRGRGDHDTADVLQEGLDKLAKYYKLQERSEAYGNALILTPYIKMAYLEKWWTDSAKDSEGKDTGFTLAEQARQEFLDTYLDNYAPSDQASMSQTKPQLKASTKSLWGDIFGGEESGSTDFLDDAERYLKAHLTMHPEKGGPDSLRWWRDHQSDHPYVAPMARDYLPIQGSATPVERVWSSASDTDTKKRNRLSAHQLEALQFLKSMHRKARVKTLTSEQREALTAARLRVIDDGNWDDDVVQKVDISVDDIEECLDLTI